MTEPRMNAYLYTMPTKAHERAMKSVDFQARLRKASPFARFFLKIMHPRLGSKTAVALAKEWNVAAEKINELEKELSAAEKDLAMKNFILRFDGNAKKQMESLYNLVMDKNTVFTGDNCGAVEVESTVSRAIGIFKENGGAKVNRSMSLQMQPLKELPINLSVIEKLVVCALEASRQAYPGEIPQMQLNTNGNTGGLALSFASLPDDAIPLLTAAAMKANEYARVELDIGSLRVELRPKPPSIIIK